MEILFSVCVIVLGALIAQLMHYKFKKSLIPPVEEKPEEDVSEIIKAVTALKKTQKEQQSKLSKLSLVAGMQDVSNKR